MRIALDAAAGDFGLAPNIEGALRAVSDEADLQVILVGPREEIRRELSARGVSETDARLEVVDAPQSVGMAEEPAAACRAKPRCAIMVCAELAAQGRAAGLVSVGNSGATMVASLWHLKRIPGVLRPAIAVAIPTPRGPTLLLDAGANVDGKPWHLLQFAAMGSIYAELVLGRERPQVGLLSIGEEQSKGNELVKGVVPLLKSSGLGFHGMVEGRDIPAGTTEVVVCDGFVGNVAVKLMEGAGQAMSELFRDEIARRPLYRAAAFLLRKPFRRVKARLSYDEYGGAPLLGVDGSVVICHGRSNAKAIANALKAARDLASRRVGERIRAAVENLKQSLETSRI